MKKILFIAIAFITATTMFALPPPNVKAPKRSTGPRIVFRKDITSPQPNKGGVSRTPNSAMANAVFISGIAAMGARMVEEIANPPQPTVIVVPEGTPTPIVIKEQEPIVKHPVPISPLSIEVMKSR